MDRHSIRLCNIVMDCADAKQLADFYAALLGGTAQELFPGLVSVRVPDCPVCLLCSREDDYAVPVWPEEPEKPQKSEHLDFTVDDLDAAVARAVSLGARVSDYQFKPEAWKTLFDPAGHPFCLCR